MFQFTLIVLVLLPLGLMLWCAAEPLLVLQRGSVGTFRSAASHGGTTSVTTSTGVITVAGGFSSFVGQPLLVRATNKYGLQLCAAQPPAHCTAVSGTWIGPLPAVRHPEHWYLRNFSRIRSDLFPALMMGLITSFFAGLVAAADYSAQHRSDDDAARSAGADR